MYGYVTVPSRCKSWVGQEALCAVVCAVSRDWKGNGSDAYGRFGGEAAMWESVQKGKFGKGRCARNSRDGEAYVELRTTASDK